MRIAPSTVVSGGSSAGAGRGWFYINKARETTRVLFRREAARLVLRHLPADEAEEFGEGMPIPRFLERDAGVSHGGVTALAHPRVHVLPAGGLRLTVDAGESGALCPRLLGKSGGADDHGQDQRRHDADY